MLKTLYCELFYVIWLVPRYTYSYPLNLKVRNIYNAFLGFKYACNLKSVHILKQLENVSLWTQSLLCIPLVWVFFPFIVHNRVELKFTT